MEKKYCICKERRCKTKWYVIALGPWYDWGEASQMGECRDRAKDKDIDHIMKNIWDWAMDFNTHDNPLKNFKHGIIWLKFQLMTILP